VIILGKFILLDAFSDRESKKRKKEKKKKSGRKECNGCDHGDAGEEVKIIIWLR
jgi:hypothetical protein